MQQIHAGNDVHPELDEACLKAFDQALADVGLFGEPAARASAYFRRVTDEPRVWAERGVQVPSYLPFNFEN